MMADGFRGVVDDGIETLILTTDFAPTGIERVNLVSKDCPEPRERERLMLRLTSSQCRLHTGRCGRPSEVGLWVEDAKEAKAIIGKAI